MGLDICTCDTKNTTATSRRTCAYAYVFCCDPWGVQCGSLRDALVSRVPAGHVVARDASTEICLSIFDTVHLTPLHTFFLLHKVVNPLSTRSSPTVHARGAHLTLHIVRSPRPKASLRRSPNGQPPAPARFAPRHASEGGQTRTTTCGRRGTTVTRRAAAESQLGRHRGL